MSNHITKLLGMWRKKERVCWLLARAMGFFSYFDASCSIARAYNDTIVPADNASEIVSRYF